MSDQPHPGFDTEDDQARTPWHSAVLAWVAMLPIAAGTAAALTSNRRASAATRMTIEWAGGVLCFLSGVRRGLSFRQKGGPTFAQLVSMFLAFVPATGALLMPRRVPALLLLLFGYGSAAMLDPAAAKRGEAPRYFARLRPVQLALPICCVALLLAKEGSRTDDKA